MAIPDERGHAYLEATVKAIQDVSSTFKREPGSFLFESDIRALLYARLFDGLAAHTLNWSPEGKRLRGIDHDGAITLNPVKSEYPSAHKFDIAILDTFTDRAKWAWDQPVRVGIEIKLWQADGATGASIEPDREKLNQYFVAAQDQGRAFTGLCIAFCHSSTDRRLRQWVASTREHNRDLIVDELLEGVHGLVVSPMPSPA